MHPSIIRVIDSRNSWRSTLQYLLEKLNLKLVVIEYFDYLLIFFNKSSIKIIKVTFFILFLLTAHNFIQITYK